MRSASSAAGSADALREQCIRPCFRAVPGSALGHDRLRLGLLDGDARAEPLEQVVADA
jgi:hypothetical protein